MSQKTNEADPTGADERVTGAEPERNAGGDPVRKKTATDEEAEQLAREMGKLLLEKQASEVVLVDVRRMSGFADFFIIASGDSEPQIAAMTDHLERTLRKRGVRPLSIEGRETRSWVLLDYGQVVAHLFHPETRYFYDLEGLWAEAPRETLA